jgi:hypothetical protein
MRNFVVCNQSLCNCMQLGVIYNLIGCVYNYKIGYYIILGHIVLYATNM